MSFTSLEFIGFLLAVVVLYYIVPKKYRWIELLVASYTFYLINGIPQIAFIIATTLITYFAAIIMQKRRDRYKAELDAVRDQITKEEKQVMKKTANSYIHTVQVLAVLADLIILAVVKYLGFVLDNVNSVFASFNSDFSLTLPHIIVPLGISFYTFASMGYLIDIGRGKYNAERNVAKLALFVSFFPTIIQGPICRFDEVAPGLFEGHELKYDNLKFGAQLIMWGFFKKMVIADRAALYVTEVFSTGYDKYSGTALFFGMFMYAVQIYGDFSGGIDIARGAAQMMGIELPNNFERPYFSQSVAEYWRRWHITLGAWMREYVFFPIMLSKPVSGLSKKARKVSAYLAKMVPSVITPFIVFILIGIWHGASWKYVAFGLYNAIIVASSVALDPVFDKLNKLLKINTEAFSWRVFRIIRTFLILGVSKILVKAPSLTTAIDILRKIFTEADLNFFKLTQESEIFSIGINPANMLVLAFGVFILFVTSCFQESGIHIRESLAKQNLVFRWVIYIIALILILVFGMYGSAYNAADFIYKAY